MSLGPQGRALMSIGTYHNQVPQDLDLLIHDLRFPLPDTTINKVLGYLYHYVPYVKYEHNLKLVIASFLNNPLCFGNPVPSFEQNYLIIEVFKLITDKKLKISKPTLSIKAWYDIILTEVVNFASYKPIENSWKVLPILSGLILSNELRDQLYTVHNPIEYKFYFKDWDSKANRLFKKCLGYNLSQYQNNDITYLSLIGLAVVYKKNENVFDYTGNISSHFIIRKLIQLVFDDVTSSATHNLFFSLNPNDPDLDNLILEQIIQKPVVKHLNKFSFLLESYLKKLPINEQSFQLVESVLVMMKNFNQRLSIATSQHPILNTNPSKINPNDPLSSKFWFFMKSLLFAEVIIFQGIMTRFLITQNNFWIDPFNRVSLKSKLELEYKQISFKIMHSLYYLNFILLSIGQGGFDNYNFIYYLTLEIVLKNNRGNDFENFTRFLIGNYNEVNLHAQVLNTNYLTRCKVSFVLGLWENYLQQDHSKNSGFINNEIFQICLGIVKNSTIKDFELIETSHSVLLICFSKTDDTDYQLRKTFDYIELLLHQFPQILSANQLSIAIETLGKKILANPIKPPANFEFHNSAEYFLDFLNLKCSSTIPGVHIKKPDDTATFSSAQPIVEIDAASTLSHIDEKKHPSTDIVDRNKMKKPKDRLKVDLINTGQPKKQYQFTQRTIPNTSREAIIISFFNIIPYFPLSIFIHWLNKIWDLVLSSNPEEQEFLGQRLWKVLSENLDLNRSELAYRWWYEEKNAVQHNPLKL